MAKHKPILPRKKYIMVADKLDVTVGTGAPVPAPTPAPATPPKSNTGSGAQGGQATGGASAVTPPAPEMTATNPPDLVGTKQATPKAGEPPPPKQESIPTNTAPVQGTVTFANGAVTGVLVTGVTDPTYKDTPFVSIVGGGGYGATAKKSDGPLQYDIVSGGFDYFNAPEAIFTKEDPGKQNLPNPLPEPVILKTPAIPPDGLKDLKEWLTEIADRWQVAQEPESAPFAPTAEPVETDAQKALPHSDPKGPSVGTPETRKEEADREKQEQDIADKAAAANKANKVSPVITPAASTQNQSQSTGSSDLPIGAKEALGEA